MFFLHIYTSWELLQWHLKIEGAVVPKLTTRGAVCPTKKIQKKQAVLAKWLLSEDWNWPSLDVGRHFQAACDCDFRKKMAPPKREKLKKTKQAHQGKQMFALLLGRS